VRRNAQALLNEEVRKYNTVKQLHALDPSSNPAPETLPTLDRHHYGIILSGREEDKEKGVCMLQPAFHRAFSKEKNLEAWAFCGAIPLTRRVLQHPSVRHEIVASDNQLESFDPEQPVDWQTITLNQMEQKNVSACEKLSQLGFNGDVFKIQASRQSHTSAPLVDLTTAAEDEIVKALSEAQGTLSSIYHTVGTCSVSRDEFFRSIKYKSDLQEYNKRKQLRTNLEKRKEVEVKAKQIDVSKSLTVPMLRILLQWKLTEEEFKSRVSNGEAKKKAELELLWNEFKERDVPDIELPSDEMEPPPLPLIEDTALAQSCTDLCRQTVAATTKMSVEDVKKIAQELLKSCEERGIDIYEA
jgi:hypothetical protein